MIKASYESDAIKISIELLKPMEECHSEVDCILGEIIGMVTGWEYSAMIYMADVDEDFNRNDNPVLSMSIFDVDLPKRAAYALEENGVKTVGDLTKKTESELLYLRNYGRVSHENVLSFLSKNNLKLAGRRYK